MITHIPVIYLMQRSCSGIDCLKLMHSFPGILFYGCHSTINFISCSAQNYLLQHSSSDVSGLKLTDCLLGFHVCFCCLLRPNGLGSGEPEADFPVFANTSVLFTNYLQLTI